MRFKVPQDVQREDQILWFITLRQLVILIVGGGISYGLFTNLSKIYELNTLELVVIAIPALISVAFAFLKIHGISLTKFILLLVEAAFFRAPRRRWQKFAGTPFVSMTTQFSMKTETKKQKIAKKNVSAEKIRNLAKILDQELSDFQKSKNQSIDLTKK